jgi:hypothetical protein
VTNRAILILALAACGGKGGPATETARPARPAPEQGPAAPAPVPAKAEPPEVDVVGEMGALADKMCACTDRACAEAVNQEFNAWFDKNKEAAGSLDEQEQAEQIARRYTTCLSAATGSADDRVDPSEISAARKASAKRVVAMFEAVAAVVKKHAASCDKMAAGIGKVAARNKALIAEAKSLDDEPKFRAWFDQTYGDRLKAVLTEAVTLVMQSCAEDEGVQKAFQSLSGE